MGSVIRSLHHLTATVNEAQADLDFYVRLLGLRLVKKTVNFDNPLVFHFYYGNEQGTPGTIMTTFPYQGYGVPTGRIGAGQVTVTSFSVPPDSLPVWRKRLAEHGVATKAEGIRFEEPFLAFDDPSGLAIELIGTPDGRTPWTGGLVDPAVAIRGIHSVTLSIGNPARTLDLLQGPLGFAPLATEGVRHRMSVGSGGAGHLIDVVETPSLPTGLNGIGTVHHVALAIGTAEEQLAIREELVQVGVHVTEVRDRQYFTSIYFREPGGVLYEIATLPPGFTIDEPLDELGQALKLPPWEEPHRGLIEKGLPPIVHP